MSNDLTLEDFMEQELSLLDSLGQIIREMGHEHLANIVGGITDIVTLRLVRNMNLLEQSMGCRLAVQVDESGMIEGTRMDFGPEPMDEETGTKLLEDPDMIDMAKKQ